MLALSSSGRVLFISAVTAILTMPVAIAADVGQAGVGAAAASLAAGMVAAGTAANTAPPTGGTSTTQPKSNPVAQSANTFADLVAEMPTVYKGSDIDNLAPRFKMAEKYATDFWGDLGCDDIKFHTVGDNGEQIELTRPEKELAKLLRQASKGDDRAQYEVGFMFENGYLITKCVPKALAWYRLSAKSGNAKAVSRVIELGCGAALNSVPEFHSVKAVASVIKPELVSFLGSDCAYGKDRFGIMVGHQ